MIVARARRAWGAADERSIFFQSSETRTIAQKEKCGALTIEDQHGTCLPSTQVVEMQFDHIMTCAWLTDKRLQAFV